MLHHISFAVADLERAAKFYDAALHALGYRRVWEGEVAIGYGYTEGEDKFAIKRSGSRVIATDLRFHLAFAAPARIAVNAFYEAALQQGGRDNGAPGLRPQYGPNYYAAFVIDPDGYPIEAVTEEPT